MAMSGGQGYLRPRRVGKGPKNLPKTASAAIGQVSARGARPSRASNPRISSARASAGVGRIPAGGGGGIPKATTPMASAPKKTINKPKTGRPKRGAGKPRADFPSKI